MLNKFKFFEDFFNYSTNDKFFSHISPRVNLVSEVLEQRIPQFPQQLLLLNYLFYYLYILEQRRIKQFIEFNLRKKYIECV